MASNVAAVSSEILCLIFCNFVYSHNQKRRV